MLLVLYMSTYLCNTKPSFRISKVAPIKTHTLSFAKKNVTLEKVKLDIVMKNFNT